MEQHGSSSGS